MKDLTLDALDALQELLARDLPRLPDTFIMPPATAAKLRAQIPRHDRVFGVRIVEDPSAWRRVQFRKPKSKRKRIRKKWAKDPRNWKDVPVIYAFNAKHITMPFSIPTTELIPMEFKR